MIDRDDIAQMEERSSLIGFIIVIAIIFVLCSILVPALKRAREPEDAEFRKGDRVQVLTTDRVGTVMRYTGSPKDGGKVMVEFLATELTEESHYTHYYKEGELELVGSHKKEVEAEGDQESSGKVNWGP